MLETPEITETQTVDMNPGTHANVDRNQPRDRSLDTEPFITMKGEMTRPSFIMLLHTAKNRGYISKILNQGRLGGGGFLRLDKVEERGHLRTL